MSYIPPNKVISPKHRWQYFDLLEDKGEGNPSYALGEWDGEKVIAFRWNGYEGSPGGNPQSRGFPTWLVLDRDIYDAILPLFSYDKRKIAKDYLGK